MAHAHCMLNSQGCKHALTICNIYCFSTATWDARTHLSVALQVHCVCCPVYIHTWDSLGNWASWWINVPFLNFIVSPCIFQFNSWQTPTHALHIQQYRVSQEERAKHREGVPYVKVYRYNPKHLYPNLNGYGDNGQRSLKLWQLLHTYWLPNSC